MTIKEFKIQYALGTLSLNDKLRLAYSKRTSKKILTILSVDEYYYVRCKVASNPNTPIEVLKKLSTDNSWFVKSRIANNPNTPKDIRK